ncbi:MAG: OsmC family protein [Candidatus Omnitrophica bacterium]|nr:OsmC family protein [Candidatus Omnitrophota bacterium]
MRVRIDYLGGKRFKAYCRQHSFNIDLPAVKGGSDSAPNPAEYFLSSLGACMSLYGLKYCENTGIMCENLRVTLTAEFDESASYITKINCVLTASSLNLGDKKEDFINAMKQCLVGQTIAMKPQIVVNIEEIAAKPAEVSEPPESEPMVEEPPKEKKIIINVAKDEGVPEEEPSQAAEDQPEDAGTESGGGTDKADNSSSGAPPQDDSDDEGE